MSIQLSKKSLKILIPIVVIAAIAFFAFQYWKSKQSELPSGIASGNGRIEAKLVDAVAKDALRVKEILVDEGDVVKPGQVLAILDTSTFDSQLEEAKLRVAAAQEEVATANAAVIKQKSLMENAKIEYDRAKKLVEQNAISQSEFDTRTTQLAANTAGVDEFTARLNTAKQEVEVAKASVTTIQTHIDDATLKSPVLGRVLYRLAEPGEMLAAGGKALTLVNLEDVYMEIYLPSEQAASVNIGAEARLTVDFAPGKAAKGSVSFVSPEAQFTPKQVETKSERDKLMFRVKIQVPKELIAARIERVKTGIRGVGYVKYKENAVWPAWLQNLWVPNLPAEQQYAEAKA